MKTIDDALKRVQPEKQRELSNILNIKTPSESKLKEGILNFFTLQRIISSFNRDEIAIFKTLYSGNDEISFGELHKILGIEIDIIEQAVQNISGYLLLYIIKNRQMLNKKMDRIHCIKEISEIYKISETSEITEYLNKTSDILISKNGHSPDEAVKDLKSAGIISHILESGSIIPLESLTEKFPGRENEKRINDLYDRGILKAFNLINDRPCTYIGLSGNVLPVMPADVKKPESGTAVSNNFKAVTNILKAYDVISSSGLFLTKQGKFRKIDLKKISEAMLEISLPDGNPVAEEERAFLAMQMLNILKCLRLDRDIGVISLKSISEKIEDPVSILRSIIAKIHEEVKPADEFIGENILPQYSGIKLILSILSGVTSIDPEYLKLIFLTSCTASRFKTLEAGHKTFVIDSVKIYRQSLNFISIFGLCETVNGQIVTTEPVKRVISLLQNKKCSREFEPSRCIYISPDFTLMIPHMDIDPVSLYTIMAFTEIHKEDVVIEAAITKNSIINAKKRGMNIERFIQTLGKYAKNDIPQNLEFLLTDWTRQTISINISRPILLHSNHGSFIDEMLYNSPSKTVMTRISENYAIIDKDSIDLVVKFAKKSDAVITIFEENN